MSPAERAHNDTAARARYAGAFRPALSRAPADTGRALAELVTGADALAAAADRLNRTRDPREAEALALQADAIRRAALLARAALMAEGGADG